MIKLRVINILLLIFYSFSTLLAQSTDDLPKLTARVTDLTQTLSSYESNQINDQLILFEQQAHVTLTVLIIETTGYEPIEDYSIRLAESWKIGAEGKDNGLILLIAKEDRQVRIEVGYGLEEVFTDAITHRIITDEIAAQLTRKEYYTGVNNGIAAMKSVVLDQDAKEFNENESDNPVSDYSYRLFIILILGLAIGIFIFKKIVVKNK